MNVSTRSEYDGLAACIYINSRIVLGLVSGELGIRCNIACGIQASADTFCLAAVGCDRGNIVRNDGIGDADIDQVISAFGSSIKRVVLCFTPNETAGFEKSICEEEDRNFFVRGRFFEETNGDEYMFQEISHA